MRVEHVSLLWRFQLSSLSCVSQVVVMDTFDCIQLLQNRTSAPSHPAEGCQCVSFQSASLDGKLGMEGPDQDKALIESHRDLLELSVSGLVAEFKKLQEERVRIFGLFERCDLSRPPLVSMSSCRDGTFV